MQLSTGTELINPHKLLEEADVRSKMAVADFGCGTLGHYVFPAARMVGPEGKVYAIDILQSVLSGIASRIKLESATNVVSVWGDLERPNGIELADGIVDVGLLINNLYLSQSREQMMTECVRMVKKGGKLVIVDWKPSGISFGPEIGQRLSIDEARQLGEKAGLKLEKLFEPGKFHFGLIFKKP